MKIFALLLIFTSFCVHEYSFTNIQWEIKDKSALRRRLKRSGADEEPLQVSEKEVYLQTGHSYLLPCTVIQIGEAVDAIYWFKGESLDPAGRDLIIRQVYPDDGRNYETDPRYQISASHGIIIDPVNSGDTDRYWCKMVRDSNIVEDYLDATVLDETFPADSDSIVDETSVSLSAESENTIYCPLLPQAPTQTSFYWSIFTGNIKTLDIIFAKFADGATMSVQKYSETHSPEGNNGLNIESFTSREERYCCHVFEKGSDLRIACIDVTWLALAAEKQPTIVDCESAGDSCEKEIEPYQECLQLECSINNVYPRPALNWSYTNCQSSPTVFTTSWSTENQTVFNVRSKVYIIDFDLSIDECSFVCTAYGEAITDKTNPAGVTIKRLEETTSMRTVTNTYSCPVSNSAGLGVTVFLLIVQVVFCLLVCLMLLCPKSQKFIQHHVSDIPTLPWYPHQCAMPTRELSEKNSTRISQPEGDAEIPEGTALMTPEEDEVCLENRGCEEVNITDTVFMWDYLRLLVTEFAREENNTTGFQAIKDVVSTQDGGVVVIDSKGLHLFTADYHDRFVDMYGALGEKSYRCVAYFMKDKLLLGLEWGKLVTFDIANEQVHNFACITPVKKQIVQLSGLAVNGDLVLASDQAGKTITAFDQNGVCLERFDTPTIEPGFLALHDRKGGMMFFVTSQDSVRKYHIKGEKGQSKINYDIHLDITKEYVGKKSGEFKPGSISVQDGSLLVENPLEAERSLQILVLKVSSGVFERSIITEAPGIRGTKFINGDRLVLYTGDCVYVFKKGSAKPVPPSRAKRANRPT